MNKMIAWLMNYWIPYLYVPFFKLRRTVQANSYLKKSSFLIMPPAAPGSVGDEAMVVATVSYLKKKGIKHIGLVEHKFNDVWRNLDLVDEIVPMRGYVSFDDQRALQSLMNFVKVVSQYEQFCFLGADLIDGKYYEARIKKFLNLFYLADKMGVKTTIVGFSFNKNPKPGCIQSLKALPLTVRLCSRDPWSYQRLEKALDRPISLTADVAFLLEPLEDTDHFRETKKWLDEQHSQERLVIGINLKDSNLLEVYKNTIKDLYNKNNQLSFLLLPHHFYVYNDSNDYILAEKLFNLLPLKIQQHCFKITQDFSASEVKAIVHYLELVLSNRMHVAIACLGQGTPVACVTYQDKFDGLLIGHFGLEGTTIELNEALEKNTLVELLMPILENHKSMREKIMTKLPMIKNLARNNFL